MNHRTELSDRALAVLRTAQEARKAVAGTGAYTAGAKAKRERFRELCHELFIVIEVETDTPAL